MNAVYGTFIENQRQQSEIKYVQNGHEALLIKEGLMVFEQRKKTIGLPRPIQLGFAILEFAKMVMFSYYHDVLKKTYGKRIRLIYTDTDSFVLELWTRDLLVDLTSIAHTLDTSNFPKTGHFLSPLFTSANTAELFYFKLEVGRDEIVAFVAVIAKVYSLISSSTKDGKELLDISNKLKGVNRSCVKFLGTL